MHIYVFCRFGFDFRVILVDAQESFLSLCLGIIPGNAWGMTWDIEDQIWVGCLQGNPC